MGSDHSETTFFKEKVPSKAIQGNRALQLFLSYFPKKVHRAGEGIGIILKLIISFYTL